MQDTHQRKIISKITIQTRIETKIRNISSKEDNSSIKKCGTNNRIVITTWIKVTLDTKHAAIESSMNKASLSRSLNHLDS